MFARVTQFRMKPGSKEPATAMMNHLKEQIMGLQGMHNFINVMNEDGSGYVVSIVESQDVSDANAPKVAELWSAFAEFLEEPPQAVGYDVIANWNN